MKKEKKGSYDFDLIISQETLKKQQEEQREKIRLNKKREEKRQTIIHILLISIIIFVTGILIYKILRLNQEFMNSCQENHSYEYCMSKM